MTAEGGCYGIEWGEGKVLDKNKLSIFLSSMVIML
jgi:hypothetical protein